MIPKWLCDHLKDSDLEKIEKAIGQAEKKTSGEIVPMVVRQSSTVGHVPLIVYTTGLLLYYILGLQELLVSASGDYWWMIFVWAGILIPLTLFISKLPWVQRALVSAPDRLMQSEQRAMNEFYHAGLQKTDGSTGILLFVSLDDRETVVLADKAIASKLQPEIWSEVLSLMVQGIKSKNMADGLCLAIEKCGDILAEHFPIQADDNNELHDHLIIKE